MAVRDLNVYASYLGGTVKHYRDNAGLECDAVVHLEDGRWGAVEIKLGGDDLICKLPSKSEQFCHPILNS